VNAEALCVQQPSVTTTNSPAHLDLDMPNLRFQFAVACQSWQCGAAPSSGRGRYHLSVHTDACFILAPRIPFLVHEVDPTIPMVHQVHTLHTQSLRFSTRPGRWMSMTNFQIELVITWPSGPSIFSPLSDRNACAGLRPSREPGTLFSTMHGASQAYWDILRLYTARNIRTHAQVAR
jgi:hypothetical protein